MVRSVFRSLAAIEDDHWQTLFFTIALVYTAALVVRSISYPPSTRLFPLLVGAVMIGMIVLKIGLIQFADRLGLRSFGLFDTVSEELQRTTDRGGVSDAIRYRREVEMIGWAFVLLAIVGLIGFQLAILTFIPVFVYVYERDWRRTALATAVTWFGVYLIFVRLLSVPLWRGVVLPEWVVQLLP